MSEPEVTPKVTSVPLKGLRTIRGAPRSKARACMTTDVTEAMLTLQGAQSLVALMKECSGDLGKFLASFDSKAGKQEQVLSRVLQVLSRKGNELEYTEFMALWECYKRSQTLLMENRAIKALSKVTLPNRPAKSLESKDINAITSFARFWLGGHNAEQVGKARERAKRGDNSADRAEVDGIVDDLTNKGIEDFKDGA